MRRRRQGEAPRRSGPRSFTTPSVRARLGRARRCTLSPVRVLSTRLALLVLAAACLSAVTAVGCRHSPTGVPVAAARSLSRWFPRTAPAADSPQHAVDLLRWCWEHRAVSDYRGLFADDYRFGFPADSAGNPVRVRELTREEELAAATNLFAKGTATLPPARRIAVVFDPNSITRPDSRPGRDPGWHRDVITPFNLAVETSGTDYRSVGVVRFHLVRGDSALLPQELLDRGAARDSGRWYVERWEESTSGLGATLPGKQSSWWELKLRYLGIPTPVSVRAGNASLGPDRPRALEAALPRGYLSATRRQSGKEAGHGRDR